MLGNKDKEIIEEEKYEICNISVNSEEAELAL